MVQGEVVDFMGGSNLKKKKKKSQKLINQQTVSYKQNKETNVSFRIENTWRGKFEGKFENRFSPKINFLIVEWNHGSILYQMI